MNPVRGADVSAIQGKVLWETVSAELYFAFARCHVGNNAGDDAWFAKNVEGMIEVGIRPGAYFFPFPLLHLDPKAQVDLFEKAGVVGADHHLIGQAAGELPPAYDLEWPPPEEWTKRGITADTICDFALANLEDMTARWGVLPIVYSYPWFLQSLSKAKNFAQLLRYKLWIAGGSQYVNGNGKVPDLAKDKAPTVSGWGSNWTVWQHDGNGGRKLPNGVDADFNVFRGTIGELDALCCGVVTLPPPPTPEEIAAMHVESNDLLMEDSADAFRRERADAIANAA